MKKTIALFLALLLLFSIQAAAYADDNFKGIVLKLSTNLSSTDACTIQLVECAEQIKEATDGKVEIQVYPNGELLTYAEAVEAIASDSNVIYYCAPSDWADFSQNAVILACPYVFDSIDQEVAFQESQVFKDIMGELESKGIHCLQPGWVGGYRNIICNKEIKTLADLKGLSIRVPATVSHIGMAESLGMTAIGMAWTETLTAASQGSIDAVEGTWSTVVTFNLWDYFKYVVNNKHILQAECLWMSSNVWNSIPAEYQAIVQEILDAGQKAYVEVTKASEEALRKQAEDAGMIVLDIDLTEFKAAAAPFCTQFPLGQEVLDTLKDIPA